MVWPSMSFANCVSIRTPTWWATPSRERSSAAAAPDATASGLQLTPQEKAALGSFHARLKVKRDTSSRLVLVSFSSRDPQLAALVANTTAQTFIEDTFQNRHNAIMKSSEWLSRQLDDIRTKMESSSKALAEFQGSIGVADVDGDKSTYTEHMGELSRQYTQAESERIQLEALLKNIQGNPDSLPEVRNNPVVQQLSQKLAEERAELSQSMVVYGTNHPVAKKLQSHVDELQSQLNSQKHAIVNSIRASYAAAEAREQLMAAEMKGTTKELGQMARYTALKKEVQTDVDLYNSLYAKIKEAGIAAASKSANIRLVDPAMVPDSPTSPRRMLNLAVGLLAAIFGGVVLAFVREELDNKLHSAGRHPALDWEFQCFDYSRHRRSGASAAGGGVAASGWWDICPRLTPRKIPKPTTSSWRDQIRLKVKPCRLCMPPSCCPGRAILRRPC